MVIFMLRFLQTSMAYILANNSPCTLLKYFWWQNFFFLTFFLKSFYWIWEECLPQQWLMHVSNSINQPVQYISVMIAYCIIQAIAGIIIVVVTINNTFINMILKLLAKEGEENFY